MAREKIDGLRRLLSGALPFPDKGRVFLVDTGLEFLAVEASAAVGPDRIVFVERHLGHATGVFPQPALHAARAEPEAGDMVILAAGRNRQRLFQDLEYYAKAVGPSGMIALFGTRKEGMHPAEDLLQRHGRDIKTTQKGGARLKVVQPREDEVDWQLEEHLQSFVIEARQQRVQVSAVPGVFSWDRLDGGSALLLESVRTREGDRLLDLACGNGVLTAVLLAEGVISEATLTDADALALSAARETLTLNGQQGEIIASDAGDGLPPKAYDLILCNPPYHSGSMQERGTGQRMIEQCARLLATRGRVLLVAPVFHDHGPELERLFRSHGVALETPSFRVWRAARPRRQARRTVPTKKGLAP
jgi:16S rRNA (guanine1207-N2)-methyltransferase